MKVGDEVIINPNWDKSKGDCGIIYWKDYIGRKFIIEQVGSSTYILRKFPYIVPRYMLMPMNGTIRGKLMKGK